VRFEAQHTLLANLLDVLVISSPPLSLAHSVYGPEPLPVTSHGSHGLERSTVTKLSVQP
jgi:hypothetical protein